jgi:hypothetical protein
LIFIFRAARIAEKNGLEDLKMAVSREYWHFQLVGMKMTFTGLLKMSHAAIFRCSACSPPTGGRRR